MVAGCLYQGMRQPQIYSQVIDLKKDTFRQIVIQDSTPILIDFWAPWCGPCRTMGPILEAVENELRGEVRVAKVNVEKEREIASAFNIRSIPTCVLMQGPDVLKVLVGVQPLATLVKEIRMHVPPKGEIK